MAFYHTVYNPKKNIFQTLAPAGFMPRDWPFVGNVERNCKTRPAKSSTPEGRPSTPPEPIRDTVSIGKDVFEMPCLRFTKHQIWSNLVFTVLQQLHRNKNMMSTLELFWTWLCYHQLPKFSSGRSKPRMENAIQTQFTQKKTCASMVALLTWKARKPKSWFISKTESIYEKLTSTKICSKDTWATNKRLKKSSGSWQSWRKHLHPELLWCPRPTNLLDDWSSIGSKLYHTACDFSPFQGAYFVDIL